MNSRGALRSTRRHTALGSARERHACLEVARAFGFVDALDPAHEDQLQHVTATLIRLVDGPR